MCSLVTDGKDNNIRTKSIMALDTTYGTLNETALESDGGDHTIDYAYFTHLHHYQTRQIKIKSYIKMHIKFISIRILLSLELTITFLD
jgi:hypothetical protein